MSTPESSGPTTDEAGSLFMLRFKSEALEQLGLPDIDYPLTSDAFDFAMGASGNLPFEHMLFGLQLLCRNGNADWQGLEPALARLAELIAPDDPRSVIAAGSESWWLELGPVDLDGPIVTVQRQELLIAALGEREDGRLRVAVYRPLDAKSADKLISAGLVPYQGQVWMRENNWQYALDCSAGMGNHYAYQRGEAHLSYWENGIGLTHSGEEVPGWRAMRTLQPRAPAHVAMDLGVRYALRAE